MRLAEWLLWTFGVDESVFGDLMEERAAGRSTAWLLRQTAAGIAVHVWRDLRSHPLLALRAIATSWLLTLSWAPLLRHLQPRHTAWAFLFGFAVLVWPAIVGRVIARTHRAQQAAMVLAYVASVASWCCCYYIVHLEEIHRFYIGMSFTCVSLLSTLVGGFLPTHTKSTLTE